MNPLCYCPAAEFPCATKSSSNLVVDWASGLDVGVGAALQGMLKGVEETTRYTRTLVGANGVDGIR